MATFALPSRKTQSVSAPTLPRVPALERPPGSSVRVDLAVSLTSQELYTVTAGRELQPGGCIAVSPSGVTLALGSMARQMEGRVPPHVRVLQPLQGGRVRDSQLAIRVLEHAFREAGYRGPVGPRVLLQVPNGLTDSEKRSVTEAARAAGARSVELVDQCRVAAAGANLPLLLPQASLIVHLDATSAEAAVISYGRVLDNRGLTASWQHWQGAVCDLVRRDFQVEISMFTADTLLRSVGCATPGGAEEHCSVGGRDLARGLPRKIEVSSRAVHEAIAPSLDQLAGELQSLVTSSSHEQLQDLVKNGLTLAGPGAGLKGLQDFLNDRIHLGVHVQAEGEGLLRLLREKDLRSSLLGVGRKLRLWKPTRVAAAAVLLLGLLGVTLSLAPPAAGENPLQASMAPLWKAAAPSPPVSPASAGLSQEERRRQQQIQEENDRLRSMVKLRSAPYARGGVLAARVLTYQPPGWPGMFVLDSGASQGVKVGMPVVTSEGLAGTVSSVSRESSRVRLLTHPNTVISARVGRAGAKGVLYGRNQKLCELRFLDPETKIRPGEIVTSSGLDGRYPAGIRLGEVTGLAPQKAVYSSVLVRPFASESSTEVLLLRR
ncbi:hypothetical protein ABS71_10130 [bacterium SCN 62-11]|mgnify:CR=1 FL=1|nr:rod shape-determining protein [Candidatus Eremiobacteraeota bacterium]ODT68008.1 MAG: hypothetical protein ABS71_10130 [bacterium SCN 62-11]